MYEGLSSKQVQERFEKHLNNEKVKKLTKSNAQIIRQNVFTYFNFINLILFFLVLLTGKIKNGLFLGTVIFNACIGIYQQMKSKKLLDRLSFLAEDTIKVKRDGKWVSISLEEIVADDLIEIVSGMQFPVDGIVLDGNGEADESSISGESQLVEKQVNDFIYAGTNLTSGKVLVKVEHVSKQCMIYRMIEDASKESPASSCLHQDLEKMIKIISICIIPAGALLFLTQYMFMHLTMQDALLKTIAALVGMIPEGLVVLTTIALAVSTIRESKNHVLIQDFFSIEALARVNTVCFDKTGTLTTGNMSVVHVEYLGNDKNEVNTLLGSYLQNEEAFNQTSQALLKYFDVNHAYALGESLPFSSKRKYAAKVLKGKGTLYVGAYSYLCKEMDASLQEKIDFYTQQGKRVLAVGFRQEETIDSSDAMSIIALVVIQDEMRKNAKEIIAYFKKQNIQVCMISGDDPKTVASLAKMAGVDNSEHYVDVSRSYESMDALASNYTIFGRVRPEEKKQLVCAMQKQGKIVLMSGDGVNDVPALKVADVSISIKDASSAAKNTANIILMDNDFSKIPSIVNEGRRVINNISRASSMYLVKTVFSFLLTLYVICTRNAYPFLPIHLTLISAIGVGIPTFILQMEPSFERIQGKFLRNAFLKALPSSLTVFLAAFLCMHFKRMYSISELRFYGIFVFLSGYVYLWTLLKVYQPFTKRRLLVIGCMSILLGISLVCFESVINVSIQWKDAWLFFTGIIVEPVVIYVLTKGVNLYDQKTAE